MEREIHVELKYCERCGGLWLRERGSGEVYCRRCSSILNEWPDADDVRVVRLPVGRRSVSVQDIDFEIADVHATAWLVPGGEA